MHLLYVPNGLGATIGPNATFRVDDQPNIVHSHTGLEILVRTPLPENPRR